ncbi:DUF58 domain-containing protein [Candidatus Binatia bacterium]|nr:DUF58 domain-containing protein [Candidatus Binatia bacterium]
MLTPEQLKTVRKIQIRTSHLVSDVFAGQYHSVFKGRGMEFAEVRHYLPGDDVRTIDWNVTARTGVPHVKRFVEERELTVMLLVDASASTHFGTVRQLKSEMAAELAAVFAFSAITNNDKVGLVMFSDHIELSLRPKKGTRHVLRVIREVLSFKPRGRGTNIAAALEHLGHVSKRRCVTFVISDFLDPTARAALALANRRHDVVGVVLDDPSDSSLPDVGLIELEDAESGDRLMVDTGNARLRREFERRATEARTERDRMLRSADVDAIALRTDRPYAEALLGFFRMRERRH